MRMAECDHLDSTNYWQGHGEMGTALCSQWECIFLEQLGDESGRSRKASGVLLITRQFPFSLNTPEPSCLGAKGDIKIC